MAKDYIPLGDVAARGAPMLEIRCGRCDRHGRLSVARLLAEWGADASIRDIMHKQIGSCPHRNDTQLCTRCDPYCQRSWSCWARLGQADMAYVPMNRVRALVIVHEPAAYAPTRVRDAASYVLDSSVSTEDEKRLANEAIAWLQSKRDEANRREDTGSSREDVEPSDRKQPAVKPKRKGR